MKTKNANIGGSFDRDNQTLSTSLNPDGSTSSILISEGNSVPIVYPPINLTVSRVTKTVGFASGTIIVTGSNLANPTINIAHGFNIDSVVASGTTNDTRRFTIQFSTNHPNGVNYEVTNSKASDEPNGDERKIQWKTGSKTASGFIMELSVDDNGGAEDPNVFDSFDFVIEQELTFIEDVFLNGASLLDN